MRAAITALLMLAITGQALAECITVPFGVRQADVIAVARYAGERTFTVESILRSVVPSPAKIVAPEDWRVSQCAPPEPVPGQAYLVALHRTGYVQYLEPETTAAERALIDRLHNVTSREILDVLARYSTGDMNAKAAEEWMITAVVDTRAERVFSAELLEAAESLISGISWTEVCHEKALHALRVKKLPKALRAIERSVPAVDTEEEFVRRYLDAIKDPVRRAEAENYEAVEAFDEIAATIPDALGPLQKEVDALPACEREKPQ